LPNPCQNAEFCRIIKKREADRRVAAVKWAIVLLIYHGAEGAARQNRLWLGYGGMDLFAVRRSGIGRGQFNFAGTSQSAFLHGALTGEIGRGVGSPPIFGLRRLYASGSEKSGSATYYLLARDARRGLKVLFLNMWKGRTPIVVGPTLGQRVEMVSSTDDVYWRGRHKSEACCAWAIAAQESGNGLEWGV